MDQIHAFALFFVIEESAVDKFSEKKLPHNSTVFKNICGSLLLQMLNNELRKIHLNTNSKNKK